MSDWAKTLLADVARECDERCIFPEEYVAVLERRLLGLLEAGEAMRDCDPWGDAGDHVVAHDRWDAAKAKAVRP